MSPILSTVIPPIAVSPVADAERADGAGAGITVLIPTSTSSNCDRVASFRTCIASLRAHLPPGLPAAVLVVDNGLRAEGARAIGQVLTVSGLPYRIVAAWPGADKRHRTAAHARNAGLAALADPQSPRLLRNRYLLFLDDDTAVAPGAVGVLASALDELPRAIAVCPKIDVVPDLDRWHADAGSSAGRRCLPGPLYQDKYDLLSVTSHGSCVAGRIVGLLARQEPLLRWIRRGGQLFYEQTPFGSSEDMLAMANLARFGELWSVPGAKVADQSRGTPGSTREQQFGWGYDHAWLAWALSESGLVHPGVHVLSWDDTEGWTQVCVDAGGATGFLINPAELRAVGNVVQALTADQGIGAALFTGRARVVASGARVLMRVLDWWEDTRGTSPSIPRHDLPPLTRRDWDSLRDGLEALVGHLAGNMAGTHDIDPTPASLPKYFRFGARQPSRGPAGIRELPDDTEGFGIMSYRIGIIGAGFITQDVLVTAINNTDGLSLTAVLDPDRRAIEAISRMSPDTVCTDSEETFSSVQLDAVHVATPNNLHEYYACRALSMGMATLVEKPLAGTMAAGRRILAAHQRSVAPAMIGYMSKHNSTNRRVQTLIEEGAIGPLRAMTARSLSWCEGNWRNTRREAGLGSLGDLAIYPVLTAVQLFGADPTDCQAVVWPSGDPELTDIFAEGTVWFGGERHLHLQSSFTFHEPTSALVSEYTVVGSDGLMHVSGSWAMNGGGSIELFNRDGHKIIRPTPVNPYAEQYLLLAASSRGAPVPPAVSLERGLSDLWILCALEDSSAHGGARIELGSDSIGVG